LADEEDNKPHNIKNENSVIKIFIYEAGTKISIKLMLCHTLVRAVIPVSNSAPFIVIAHPYSPILTIMVLAITNGANKVILHKSCGKELTKYLNS
jgi:hypothetical protein